ncbi:hypothetical protein HDU98_005496 [Podochytrium sp. JEL0797]|nr:hypothetical protein HDU98_005496 [Podochytrium sp. JEL0797]
MLVLTTDTMGGCENGHLCCAVCLGTNLPCTICNSSRRNLSCASCGLMRCDQKLKTHCSHNYCSDCLIKMAVVALPNGAVYPVKCCGREIPQESLRLALSGSQFEQYLQRGREIEVAVAAAKAASVAEQAGAQLKDLISKNCWRICPNCGVGVEKVGGCNHIVCLCKAEFCYRCSSMYQNGTPVCYAWCAQ